MNPARIQYVKHQLAEQISSIESAGFGYFGPVIRKALFSTQLTDPQWKVICDEFDCQNPEKTWKVVNAIN